MIRVTSTEFGAATGRYQDAALKEVVIITHHRRDRTVLMSAREYRRLTRGERKVSAAGDSPVHLVKAIQTAAMDSPYDKLYGLREDDAQ